ncbi:MAG: ParB/RepB/Spo0J family partition protein [Gammaproteobacteria bacterium]|nr:ParB/RepB/Spo0J family partition protein [Gammaproteobacteria bacterium]
MPTRKSGLGRGLEALIPKAERTFSIIPIEKIRPNPRQPRENFDEEALASLAASIQEVGLLQPIIVNDNDEGVYTLVAGERRLRAARRVGLSELPVIIRQGEDDKLLTEALIENLQREDLTVLEEAAAYQQLLDDFLLTHEEIGRRVGKSRSAVTNALRLLQLPASIQGMLERGELTGGHARALLGLEDRAFCEHVAHKAAEEGWSVRQVEDAVRVRNRVGEKSRRVRAARPAAIIALEERLQDSLKAPVHIRYGAKKKGRISIEFSSLDDLERIFKDLL